MRVPRNLLMIVADQFRADLLLNGYLSNCVETPNLDGLAESSLCFANHHSVVTPCAPARASLLTGKYAFRHGVMRNGAPLLSHHPTLPKELRKLGHEPLLFGYTDTQPDPHGMDPNDPAHQSYTAPAPGFTEVQEMREESWAWIAHLRKQGYDVPDAGNLLRTHVLYKPKDGIVGNPALYEAKDSDTAFLTDRTLEQLDVRKSDPWTAMVNYTRPHPPFVAPAPYNAQVLPGDIPGPAATKDDHPFFTAFYRNPGDPTMIWGFDGKYRNMDEALIAQTRATYLGLVAELDFHIGRLLTWLRDSGQEDETLVVFTADHGEMLGDLGTWGKSVPFRQATHVPMMIRGVGIDPSTVETPSESIDVTPTLLSVFGGQVPEEMNGRNLLQQPGQVAMCEVELGFPNGNGAFEELSGQEYRACRAVSFETSDYRLIHFANGFEPMLFDMRSDPRCCTDLARSKPEKVSEMHAQLLDHRIRHAVV